ncbi:MAG TPA: hypothetical protein VGM33_12360 [Baekduia sp.]|jgi:hypothetical protein
MAERIDDPDLDDDFPSWPLSVGIPDNRGIRPLHRVLFQQFLRPFRALRDRTRR